MGQCLAGIFLIVDAIHERHDFSNLFLKYKAGHRVVRRCTLPMSFAWGPPNDVSRTNLDDVSTLRLYPTCATKDNNGLSERVHLPRRPGAGAKGNRRTGKPAGRLTAKVARNEDFASEARFHRPLG